jgi:hypothetical protein
VGVSEAYAAAISLALVVALVLLAWYSMRQAKTSGGKTTIEFRAAGIVHFKFGAEINPSHGDRSANQHEQLEAEPPPALAGGDTPT